MCKDCDELASVDLFALRLIPDGADKPLPFFTLDDITLTPADVRRAIRKWDRDMPAWAGILEAKLAP